MSYDDNYMRWVRCTLCLLNSHTFSSVMSSDITFVTVVVLFIHTTHTRAFAISSPSLSCTHITPPSTLSKRLTMGAGLIGLSAGVHSFLSQTLQEQNFRVLLFLIFWSLINSLSLSSKKVKFTDVSDGQGVKMIDTDRVLQLLVSGRWSKLLQMDYVYGFCHTIYEDLGEWQSSSFPLEINAVPCLFRNRLKASHPKFKMVGIKKRERGTALIHFFFTESDWKSFNDGVKDGDRVINTMRLMRMRTRGLRVSNFYFLFQFFSFKKGKACCPSWECAERCCQAGFDMAKLLTSKAAVQSAAEVRGLSLTDDKFYKLRWL